MKKSIITATLTTLTTVASYAGDETAYEKQALINFNARYVGKISTATHATMSPTGLWEITVGTQILYVDKSMRYIIAGRLIDGDTQKDITAEAQERASTLSASDLKELDALATAKGISRKSGSGAQKLYVFADPDCPYCRQLERSVAELTDTTVYILPYPLAELHPGAQEIMLRIMCSPNPSAAWQGYLLEQKQPEAISVTKCTDDLATSIKLGAKLNVVGTPTLFASDGRRLSGALPIDALKQWLKKS